MTVRVKLALLYGLLFLVAGAALLGISYQLVSRNLPTDTVTEVSGTDVALRAAKLSTDPSLSAADRSALATVARLPADQTLTALKKGVTGLSPSTQAALTAALPIAVRNDALHQLLVQSSIAL